MCLFYREDKEVVPASALCCLSWSLNIRPCVDWSVSPTETISLLCLFHGQTSNGFGLQPGSSSRLRAGRCAVARTTLNEIFHQRFKIDQIDILRRYFETKMFQTGHPPLLVLSADLHTPALTMQRKACGLSGSHRQRSK